VVCLLARQNKPGAGALAGQAGQAGQLAPGRAALLDTAATRHAQAEEARRLKHPGA